jgi:hypothetical protein
MNVRRGFLPQAWDTPPVGEMLQLPWQTGAPFDHNEVLPHSLAQTLANPAQERAPIDIDYLRRMAELAYAGHNNNNPPEMTSPSQVYTAWSRMECAGLLVCARTLVEGSTSELTDLFFLIVNCTTVFRGGRAWSSIWTRQADGCPSALPPTMIPGPKHSSHTIMASCHPGLRVPKSMNARAPKDYLETGTLVCLNENGKNFHFVKGPATSEDDGELFMDWFGQHQDRNE